MKNKKLVNAALLGISALLVVGMAYQFTPALGDLFGKKDQGTPALTVNGQTVTVEELEAMKTGNPLLGSTDGGVLADDFKLFMVDQQIRQKLVTQAAGDVQVSREDVNAEVKKVREANQLTDNKAWTDALQGVGLTDATFRQQKRDELAVNRKVEQIKATAPKATDAEIEQYYALNPDKYQSEARIVGRQIVTKDAAKAKSLLAQIRAGADFAALASANSEENKDRGGALGPLENGQPRAVAAVALPTEVAQAAFALTSGGVTDVINAAGKYHIVKVERYLPAALKPLADVRTEVTTAVNEQKKNAVVEKWLDGLERTAKVEVKDASWKTQDPTVATVAGEKIPYSAVVSQVVAQLSGNQQLSMMMNQMSPAESAQFVNAQIKPTLVEQLISGYAAPRIAQKLGLHLTGTRQEQVAALNAYGARNVKVSDADIQNFYKSNITQFQTPASATVSQASFKDQNQAAAFRTDWNGQGDFVAAATKAGGTVSENGNVTGDAAAKQTLGEDLYAALFESKDLRAAGEGSLTRVVKSGQRYVVAYLTDLKVAATQPLNVVRPQIQSQLLESKKGEASVAFMEQQVAALKPVNSLKAVLDAQAKRVAAATPKAAPTTTPAPATPATPATK